MKLKNKRSLICAFSLAEMMVVMLILSIVAAASLPIITKRSHTTDSIWQWSSNNTDTYFGLGSTQGAIIGTSAFASGDATSKLMLNTLALGPNHIMFKQGDSETGHLVVDASGNVGLGSVFIGIAPPNPTVVNNATVIGTGSVGGQQATALGYDSVASLAKSVAIGTGDRSGGAGALAANAVAVGYLAKVTGTSGVALGYGSLVDNTNAIAIGIGDSSVSKGGTEQNAIAIGYLASAECRSGIVIGANASASEEGIEYGAIAIGNSATAHIDAIAIGNSATANTTEAVGDISIGVSANSTASHSIAIGPSSKTIVEGDVAIGYQATNFESGFSHTISATALGRKATASGDSTVALGYRAMADGVHAIAIGGLSPSVTNPGGITEQHYAGAEGNYSIVLGSGAYAESTNSMALGYLSLAVGSNSTALGYFAYANQNNTVQIGGSMNTKVNYYGTLTQVSDKRLKNVGSEFTDGLDKIRMLHSYNYSFKKDSEKIPQVGVMAQDLQKVFPDAVSKGSDGYLVIRKEDVFCAMINSIKQLDKIVQGLVNDVKALVVKVQKIDDKIAAVIKVDQINSQKIKKLEADNKKLQERLAKLEQKVTH